MFPELPLLSSALPQLTLMFMTLAIVLNELFVGDRVPSLNYWLSQGTLLFVCLLTVLLYHGAVMTTFSGLVANDWLSRIFQCSIYLVSFLAFFYSRPALEGKGIAKGEFYILGLLSVLGMTVLVAAHSFISIYLALELMSLPLYAMIALKRDSEKASEAALKYFVMGAVASGMLLYGMSLFYGVTGSLDLSQIAEGIQQTPADKQLLFALGLVFIVVGLGFKLASAPFHMWVPDVYTGTPNPVVVFLASAPKIAAMGMTIRILAGAFPSLLIKWQGMLILMAILSMGVGNLVAIAQTNIKRLLGYSTIGHMGYILLGLIAGTADGLSAVMFYIITYALMSVAAFGMLSVMAHKGIELESIQDFRGLGKRQPWLAFCMMLVLLSMAGIPPTVGFLAKLFVLEAVTQAGFVWLAALGMAFAVIGVFYYIRIVKLMYFDEPSDSTRLTCPPDMQVVMGINGLALLFLGLFPNLLWALCKLPFS